MASAREEEVWVLTRQSLAGLSSHHDAQPWISDPDPGLSEVGAEVWSVRGVGEQAQPVEQLDYRRGGSGVSAVTGSWIGHDGHLVLLLGCGE